MTQPPKMNNWRSIDYDKRIKITSVYFIVTGFIFIYRWLIQLFYPYVWNTVRILVFLFRFFHENNEKKIFFIRDPNHLINNVFTKT